MTLEDANGVMDVLIATGRAISAIEWGVPWAEARGERQKVDAMINQLI